MSYELFFVMVFIFVFILVLIVFKNRGGLGASKLAFLKMLRGNKKGQVNIWIRRSPVRISGRKSTYLEINFGTSPDSFIVFIPGHIYDAVKRDTYYILETFKELVPDILELIKEKRGFYLNSKWYSLEHRQNINVIVVSE